MSNDPRAHFNYMLGIDSDVYTLEADEPKRKWVVHGAPLCADSPYFRACISEKWKEGQARVIPLSDDDPRVIQLYVEWLYSKKIFVLGYDEEWRRVHTQMSKKLKKKQARKAQLKQTVEQQQMDDEQAEPDRTAVEQAITEQSDKEPKMKYDTEGRDIMFRSYIFGEKVQSKNFQNAIMDSIIAAINKPDEDGRRWYPTNFVDLVYNGTPVGSPLRRLMVDMYVTSGKRSWIQGDENPDFLIELAQELLDYNDRNRATSFGFHSDILVKNNRKYYQVD